MLKDKGEHVRKIALRNTDLLAGKDKLVLKYAVELCGSNLTSLAVSNLKVVDLKLIASCCGVLMSLSIGDLIFEDMHRVLPWLSASPNKFKHLEHFAAFFCTDNDALCEHCRLIQTTASSRKFLRGLVKSNSSLKKMVQNLNHMTYWVGRYPCPHVKTVILAPFAYDTAKTLTAFELLLFFPHDNLKDEQDERDNANKDEKVAEEEELAVHVER